MRFTDTYISTYTIGVAEGKGRVLMAASQSSSRVVVRIARIAAVDSATNAYVVVTPNHASKVSNKAIGSVSAAGRIKGGRGRDQKGTTHILFSLICSCIQPGSISAPLGQVTTPNSSFT